MKVDGEVALVIHVILTNLANTLNLIKLGKRALYLGWKGVLAKESLDGGIELRKNMLMFCTCCNSSHRFWFTC